MHHGFSSRALISFVILSAGGPAWADYADYSTEPYVFALDPGQFASLFSTAQSQTVNIAILGDSQETSPGGAGAVYIPRINYEAATYFGNAPETPLGPVAAYGGGNPNAQWLLEGSAPAQGVGPTRLAADQVLPGGRTGTVVAINGGNNIYGEYYGQMTLLEPDAAGVDPGAQIPAAPYFKTDGVVVAQIFAATNASSGEITYQAKPINGTGPNYFVPVTTTGTLDLGLQTSTFAIKSGLTAPLDFNGNSRMQVEISGTDPNTPTDLVGVRFENLTHPQGMVFTNLAAGGYTASSFLTNHGDAGAMYAALGFDAAILHYGANDSGDGFTADQFKANELQIINTLRQWTGYPNYRVILIADVGRAGLSAAQESQLDQYTGALISLAQSDPNLLVVNSQRMMNDLGWNVNNPDFSLYCCDGVHYAALGAQILAAAEFGTLSSVSPTSAGTFTTSSLTTDCNTRLAFTLVTPGAVSDSIHITGANGLTLNGGTIQIASTSTGRASLGYYKILQFSGSIGGAGLGSLVLPASTNNVVYTLDAVHDPGFIDLHRGLLGDANDDGVVNFADFVLLSNNFGQSGAGWAGGDFNGDGVTNFADFVALSNDFGGTIGAGEMAGGAASQAPEPGSLALLLAGASSLFRRRRG